MHIELADDLIRQVDEMAGTRGRSAFVRKALERALEDELRWRSLESAAGAIGSSPHDWDVDPGAWVREQRRGDARRKG